MKHKVIAGMILVSFIVGIIFGIIIAEFIGGNGDDSDTNIDKFIGTWTASEQSHNESVTETLEHVWTFYSNHSANIIARTNNVTVNKTIFSNWITYEVEGDQLIMTASSNQLVFYFYEFSDDETYLTLTTKDDHSLTFNKKHTL